MLPGGVFSFLCRVDFFSTQHIAFSLWGYKMSYTELIASLFGIAATVLSALRITYTWVVNLVATLLFAIIFYELRLYSDLILQAYYFTMGILGWLWWNKKANHHMVPVTYWRPGITVYILCVLGLAIATAMLGWVVNHFNTWMPQWFPQPAAMPYENAAVLVMSITGTYLMGKRIIENWWLWAVSNLLATYIYGSQGSILLVVIFLVYWVIGLTGWYNWHREYKKTAAIKTH